MNTEILNRRQRRARTRQELLAAAARVFAARGYHGASVSRIAGAAGYTTGALYGNFASKEELFLELVDHQLAGQQVDLDDLLAETDPQRLRARHRDLVVTTMSALVDAADAARETDATGRLTMLQLWTLTMEFLLFAVRERPDLREAINRRYDVLMEQRARAIAHVRETQGLESDLSVHELTLAHSWLVEGLGLRLVQDPAAIDPERAADIIDRLLFTSPTGA